MNPPEWEEAKRRLQRHQDLNHQSVPKSIIKNASETGDDWHRYRRYSTYTVDEPQNIQLGVSVGRQRPGSDSDGFPSDVDRCSGASLKDRVNRIFQQQHPAGFLSQGQPRKDRRNSAGLSNDGLLREHHPLKLRVKELMKQRCCRPCPLPTDRKVTDASPAPVTRPSADESSINQGFQRFLSVLNKGVDLDLLSRIVNDDSEDIPPADNLLNSEPPAVATTPYLHPSNESQPLNIKDENKNESRCHSFGSRSRSRSPPAVKKQKREGEEKATANEQHEQLQNILKTLGLSLEVDEMSRLANRTHERLYGTKHESTDNERERDRQTRGSHVSHREGSSSSSSSSSSRSSFSRSTSRSSSSSSSRHQRSHSRDSGRRRASERSDSRDKSRVRSSHRETKEQLQNRDKYAKPFVETYEPPQLQNKAHPHPDAVSKFPDHSLSHYSHYNGYQSDFYNEAASSYWTSNEGAFPPSYYPNGQPDQQNTYHPFPVSVVEPTRLYPRERDLKDLYPLANPDLAESEGQIESTSDPRCLQEIGAGKREKCSELLARSQHRKQHLCNRLKSRHLLQVNNAAEKCRAVAVLEAKAQPEKNGNNPIANNRQSEEGKQSQTEEEIKANLRKKLEAFNKMPKQKLPQPGHPHTSHFDLTD